jgi:hypothetical protein
VRIPSCLVVKHDYFDILETLLLGQQTCELVHLRAVAAISPSARWIGPKPVYSKTSTRITIRTTT